MKLIVGLGNPGRTYSNTRHNIGFMVIDSFAKSRKVVIDKKKFNGLYTTFDINNEKVILLKPQSYINLSGEVVNSYMNYFKIDMDDILIINDDLDLPFCMIRLRLNGSSAGHNGLKNIEAHLHSQDYKRMRIGIANNKEMDTKDYVLGKFSLEDKHKIEKMLETTNELLLDFVEVDFDKVMSKYN